MEIKRSGFLYQVAYGLSLNDVNRSDVSICRFFRRFVLMLCLAWPLVVVVACVMFAVVGFAGFFFARRPPLFSEMEDGVAPLFVRYKKWPEVGGRRIYPFWFALVGVVAFYFSSVEKMFLGIVMPETFWMVAAAAVAGIAVFSVIAVVGRSESFVLLKELFSAKKQKICPMIKIVE